MKEKTENNAIQIILGMKQPVNRKENPAFTMKEKRGSR